MDLCKFFVSLSCLTLVLSTYGVLPLNISHSNFKLGSNLINYERRIFEGKYVKDIKQYPFMVFIHVRFNETNDGNCGGSIISPSYVLTAAHCAVNYHSDKDLSPSDFTLYVGSVIPINASKVTIKAFYVHPQYEENKCDNDFDIAVLELNQPLTFNETISPVVLPELLPLDWRGDEDTSSSKTTTFTKSGEYCKVLGWGDTNVSDDSPGLYRELKEAEVPLISIQKCLDLYSKICEDSQICSLDPEDKTGVCRGDSGGPIICDGVQVGIMSYVVTKSGTSYVCVGPNMPNVYTRVDVYMIFINEVMAGNNASRLSDWSDTLLILLYLISIVVMRLL